MGESATAHSVLIGKNIGISTAVFDVSFLLSCADICPVPRGLLDDDSCRVLNTRNGCYGETYTLSKGVVVDG